MMCVHVWIALQAVTEGCPQCGPHLSVSPLVSSGSADKMMKARDLQPIHELLQYKRKIDYDDDHHDDENIDMNLLLNLQ